MTFSYVPTKDNIADVMKKRWEDLSMSSSFKSLVRRTTLVEEEGRTETNESVKPMHKCETKS